MQIIKSDSYKKIFSIKGFGYMNYLLLDISKYTKNNIVKILDDFYNTKDSRNKFLLRYGREQSKRILSSKNSFNIKTKSGKSASKESLLVFEPIVDSVLRKYPDMKIFISLKNRREYRLSEFVESKYKNYFYDLTFLDYKIIFEYNGSVWHPNKNNNFDNWKHPKSNITNIQKYEYDQNKINLARKHCFKIFELWDIDGVKHNQMIIKQELRKVGINI